MRYLLHVYKLRRYLNPQFTAPILSSSRSTTQKALLPYLVSRDFYFSHILKVFWKPCKACFEDNCTDFKGQESRIWVIHTCSFFQSLSNLYVYKTFSMRPNPSFSKISRIGSQIALLYGACTPGSARTPSSTSWVAIPQGMPTVRAMAE